MKALTSAYRGSMAARGIAAILFGGLACAWPGTTLLVMVILFGAWALMDGILASVGSLAHRAIVKGWSLVLLVGISSILLGVLTFVRPGLTALVLLFFIGARALVVGGLEIAAAIQYRREIRHEWLLLLAGLASALFGLAVLAFLIEGALTLVWLIGSYAILVGILQLISAFSARLSGAEPPQDV